jgi:lipoprotein NlpI
LKNRANAFVMMERYPDALKDYDAALALDPGNVALYVGRGIARLYSGAVDDSIDDFATAIKLRPSNPYPVIWLHTARLHQGESDFNELLQNAENVKRDTWPGTLLDLYLGNIDADGVKMAAEHGPSLETAKRDCEAKFFLGDYALHHGEKAQAYEALRNVISDCRPHQIVHSAAIVESRLWPVP